MRSGFVLAALSLLAFLPAAPVAAAPKNVLVIRGESPDLVGGRILTDAIRATVHGTSPSPVEFYLETIDTGRFGSEAYEHRLADLLAEKFASIPLDLVVAFSAPAVEFVVRERAALFPRVPLLFGLIEPRLVDPASLPADATVVYVRIDAAATLKLALTMRPSTRRVLVAGGASRFDRGWLRVIRDDLKEFESTVPITYDTDSSLADLLRTVSALPSDAIVLYTSMTRDGASLPQVPVDVLESLRAVAPVPIFGVSTTHLGHGIVGGALLDFDRHGADLGRQAVRMLAGEHPAPMTTAGRSAVDWRELQRWGFPSRVVPPATTIAFREPGIWERQRGTILAAGGVVAVETALIVALVRAGRRRRQAQRLLEGSDHLKSAILDSLPAHVAVLDRDGVVIAVNDAWREFVRGAKAPLGVDLGPGSRYVPTCAAAVYGDGRAADEATAVIEQACRGEQCAAPVEYSHLSQGTVRWFLMTAEPLRRAEGGAVVTHWDITERKRNELALRESEDRFRRMSDGLPVAIWMSDADGGCSYFNKQWLRITGRTLEQERGDGWLESVHAADRSACIDAYMRAFHVRDAFRTEYRLRQRDGQYRWMIDTGVPRYGNDGAFHGYVGGCVDITERKDAERMLRELSHRLMEARDAERRRIARELHDHLSQQLALLAIELQHLAMHLPASPDAIVSSLQEAWRRTSEIAGDVHAISHRLHPSKMEALGLVATMRAHCRDVSRQGAAVEFCDQDVPADIAPDRALGLFRVLEEALSNVVRHSRATEAHVTLAADNADLVLTVSDNGCGFASGDPPSGGIGLIGMRERLQSLDGTLSVTSVPGHGTVVQARVPLSPAGETRSEADTVSAPVAESA